MVDIRNIYNWHQIPEIPLAELIDRGVYEIAARGLAVGIWDAEKQGFLGYKDPYLEYEYEWDTGGFSGTATALRYLDQLPDELELRTHDPLACSKHKRPTVSYRHEENGSVWYTHHHADDGSELVGEDYSYLQPYTKMLDFLIPLDKRVRRARKKAGF